MNAGVNATYVVALARWWGFEISSFVEAAGIELHGGGGVALRFGVMKASDRRLL